MNKEKIKVVLIGFGHIGKRHALLISLNETFELAAIVDRHFRPGVKASSYDAAEFSDLSDFLASGLRADLAVIATPNGLHQEQMGRCLRHGMDIVAEKPIALKSSDISALSQLARSKGLQIFPVIQNRYARTARWLSRVLKSGTLGAVYIIQVNCFWNRDERYYQPDSWHGDKKLDGGSLFTQFLHFVDMICWLFGEPKVLDQVFYDFNHQQLSAFEDSGLIRFSFDKGAAKGALGTLQFTTAAWQTNAESSLTIIAEKGSIKIGGQYMEKPEYLHMDMLSDTDRQLLSTPDPLTAAHGAATGHFLFWEELAGAYQGQSHELPTIEEAAAVIQLIENIYHRP